MNKQIQKSFFNVRALCFIATIVLFWSCEDNQKDDFGREDFDPSKPVRIDSFEPDSGGMATKVFIHGSNFGSDLSKIEVYFNESRAPVVGSDGSHLYVITPRQPGREVTISVVSNGKTAVFGGKKYLYRTMTTVTTLTGRKGTTAFQGGTLAEATFQYPSTLCIDAEGNLFLSHWRVPYCFVLISPEKNLVQAVYPGSNDGIDAFGAPTADADGKVIMVPTDGGDGYYSFDPDAQWAPKSRLMLHPSQEQIALGLAKDWSLTNAWKHGMSACLLDKCIYTRFYNGNLVKFDPVTRQGTQVAENLMTGDDSYPFFDPYQTNILYIAYPSKHCIYTYDILTGVHELFAGVEAASGYLDGDRKSARFNCPSQLVVDNDGSIYVADRYNHCIRRITPDGMVSTAIGKGGISGYQDGNPEDALFWEPRGVAIDKNGYIYVAEWGNNVVRRLAVE